jgi:hypothetical protein
MLSNLRVYAEKKPVTANTQKLRGMVLNFNSENLPHLYFDGVMLLAQTPKYLGIVRQADQSEYRG